jgi:hypothetical protein
MLSNDTLIAFLQSFIIEHYCLENGLLKNIYDSSW